MRFVIELNTPKSLQMHGSRLFTASRLHDAAAVVFITSFAYLLYFSQADRIGMSQDGFFLTYLMQTGDLQAFNLHEAKEPGRPFLGLPWQLAALFTGGTLTGYNSFMAVTLLLSAVLVYFLTRTLAPRQPVWALLAATFKIVWSANYEVFDNSGLAIYFAEALFWLALWALAIGYSKREAHAWPHNFEVALIIIVSLVILVGIYQTPWPVVLMAPLALFAAQTTPPRPAYTYFIVVAWYLAALPMMAWCYFLSLQFVARIGAPQELLVRFGKGIWASTATTLLFPFAPQKGYSHGGFSLPVVLFTVAFALLLLWAAFRSWPAFRDAPRKGLLRALSIAGIVAAFVVAVEVLPPSLLWEPTYGTRTVHWSSLGTLLGTVAALAWLCHRYRSAGCAVAATIAIVLVANMAQQSQDIGNHYAINGFMNRRFWQDVSIELSRVDEGTIVLMDGPAAGIGTVDSFSTALLRNLTETHGSFFMTERKPTFDPVKKSYQVTSVVDLEQVDPIVLPSKYFRTPKVLLQPRTFEIPSSRVVWVEWNPAKLRLRVLAEQSAMERLHTNIPSTYGQVLFPRSTSPITAP